MHQRKQSTGQQRGQNRKAQTQQDTKQCTVKEIFLQSFPVFGPEALRHRNAEAHAGALYEAENQKIQGIGRSHGAQSIAAQAAADDHRVRKTVKLLEHRTQHQRQGKTQNLG